MQRENILYMTNSESIALFLADFYTLSTSALLEYAFSSIMHIPTIPAKADIDNAYKSAKK
jgi:hypothetical protein